MSESTRSGRKRRRIIAAAALLFAALIFVAAAFYFYKDARGSGELSVYFFDVGQGDAALAVWDGGAILFDAGTNESQYKLTAYIESLGVDTIDCAVFSHPHEDHIGGADEVLKNFDVLSVLMPDAVSEYSTYEVMMEYIEEEGCSVYEAYAGLSLTYGDVTLTVLSPVGYYDELNLESAVVRLDYGDVSYIFMGDCETEAEADALDFMGEDAFDADVIKIGHHGSYSATSTSLLDAVTPEIAVISCGRDNEYGHPSETVLSRLEEYGVTVYRTDTDGTVVITTDGTDIRYSEY
ncbi:MAG: MBL fold metallo-hydrolase [Clostridia bacterium]|nr:MBL fold metallo-hydrolase [Clostridia bacterium]